MRTHLMTRGTRRRHDYAFLGEAPPDQWWQTLARWVFMESEELIIRRQESGRTGLVISGIPSQRTDAIGTRIRHTLVVDAVQEDQRLALWLVRCGLDDEERTRLGKALDTAFDGDLVDALMSGADGEVDTRLLDTLQKAAGDSEDGETSKDVPGSWAGDVHDEASVRAFMARVRRLLTEDSAGYAFTTHALGSVSGAERAASALPDEVAVLLHDSALRGVQQLGKGPAPARGRQKTTGDRKARAAALTLAGLAVALGIWWMFRRY
ncbi:hypothetical protein AB0H18_33175 [Streptomyces sp. NPDC020766]|uniref:hypothetical protein n=1 Tax=Streptomyces sp. NPDC020766 TaxID=3155011 RepID=UPI0033D26524